MLKMTEETPARTMFEERRPGLRTAALACIGVSVLALAAVAVQWQSAVAAYPDRVSDWRVGLGLGMFIVVILFFAAASVYALLLSRTLRLVLDRESGDIVITAPRGLRMAAEKIPYYGVKSVRLTGDESLRALALVFVLRDGRVVPVTAAPAHDRDALEALAAQIRAVLGA